MAKQALPKEKNIYEKDCPILAISMKEKRPVIDKGDAAEPGV